MSDVSRIISEIENGDTTAADRLLPLVYDVLRQLAAAKLANEKPGQTLQATALVHEAYVRLVGPRMRLGWDSRGHFFAAAAEAMRRILIERARAAGVLNMAATSIASIWTMWRVHQMRVNRHCIDLDGALTKLRIAPSGQGGAGEAAVFFWPDVGPSRPGTRNLASNCRSPLGLRTAWLYRELETSRDG